MMNEETSIYDTNEIVNTYSKEPQKQEKKIPEEPKISWWNRIPNWLKWLIGILLFLLLLWFLCCIVFKNSCFLCRNVEKVEKWVVAEENIEKYIEKSEKDQNVEVTPIWESEEWEEIYIVKDPEWIEPWDLVPGTNYGIEIPKFVSNINCSDPIYTEDWYKENINYTQNVENLILSNSWFLNKEIKVAVLDTGISNHDDFKNVVNIKDIENNLDINGHGSYVAWVIHSINPTVKIVPYKVSDSEYIQSLEIYEAFNNAINDKVDIINMSFWNDRSANFVEQTLINRALEAWIIVVASAWNDGDKNIKTYFPAMYDWIKSIGSSWPYDELSDFTNAWDSLSLVAPGECIYTTNLNNWYEKVNWTSFSSPMVAWIISLYLQYTTWITPWNDLINTARTLTGVTSNWFKIPDVEKYLFLEPEMHPEMQPEIEIGTWTELELKPELEKGIEMENWTGAEVKIETWTGKELESELETWTWIDTSTWMVIDLSQYITLKELDKIIDQLKIFNETEENIGTKDRIKNFRESIISSDKQSITFLENEVINNVKDSDLEIQKLYNLLKIIESLDMSEIYASSSENLWIATFDINSNPYFRSIINVWETWPAVWTSIFLTWFSYQKSIYFNVYSKPEGEVDKTIPDPIKFDEKCLDRENFSENYKWCVTFDIDEIYQKYTDDVPTNVGQEIIFESGNEEINKKLQVLKNLLIKKGISLKETSEVWRTRVYFYIDEEWKTEFFAYDRITKKWNDKEPEIKSSIWTDNYEIVLEAIEEIEKGTGVKRESIVYGED